jgi:hypothetical protein
VESCRLHSSLGECLASWLKDKGHILIALESYFDGSATKGWKSRSGYVTLAGTAADDSVWKNFDHDWREILSKSKDRPEAKYIHMREAAHLKKEFSPKNGWTFPKVARLLHDLLGYLQTIDKQKFRQFAGTVDLAAYHRIKVEGHQLHEVVWLCNRSPEAALYWYATQYPGIIHSAHYFFDIREPFKEPFERKWNEKKTALIYTSPSTTYWTLIKSVTATDMESHPAMQAADMLAWASNRERIPLERPFRHLASLMKNIIPSTWALYDEAALRREFT